jgi:hypothetical protein
MQHIYGGFSMKKFFSAMLLASTLAVVPALAAPIVLTGNYIKVGISDGGTFGSNGGTSPGILHDPTGLGAFGVNDYLTPGSPHDGYTLAYNGTTAINDNYFAGGGFGSTSPTLLTGAAAMGFANAASWTGTTTDGLASITLSYFFNPNDQQVKIVTKITALSDLTNVAFARSNDPDPDVNTFGSFVTNNQRGNSIFGIDDFVGAAGPSTGLTLGLLNLDAAGFAHTTQINGACCSNIDPFDVLAHTGGDQGTSSVGDHGLNLAYNLGTLKSGESISLTYAYVFGDNIDVVGGGVPESSTWMMMIAGFGIAGMSLRGRRRNSIASLA